MLNASYRHLPVLVYGYLVSWLLAVTVEPMSMNNLCVVIWTNLSKQKELFRFYGESKTLSVAFPIACIHYLLLTLLLFILSFVQLQWLFNREMGVGMGTVLSSPFCVLCGCRSQVYLNSVRKSWESPAGCKRNQLWAQVTKQRGLL